MKGSDGSGTAGRFGRRRARAASCLLVIAILPVAGANADPIEVPDPTPIVEEVRDALNRRIGPIVIGPPPAPVQQVLRAIPQAFEEIGRQLAPVAGTPGVVRVASVDEFYQIRYVWTTVNVPTGVDVNGDGAPDATVLVTAAPGADPAVAPVGAVLGRDGVTPGVPARLSFRIDATGLGRYRSAILATVFLPDDEVSAGYMAGTYGAPGTRAPASFELNLTDLNVSGTRTVDGALRVADSDGLAVSVVSGRTDSVDRVWSLIDMPVVPAVIDTRLVYGPGVTEFHVVPSATVEIRATVVQADSTIVARTTLPAQQLQIVKILEMGPSARRVMYSGTGLPYLYFDQYDSVPAYGPRHITAYAEQIPSSLDVILGTDTTIVVPGSSIGLIAVGIGEGRAPIMLDRAQTGDHVNYVKDATGRSVSFLVRGLSRAVITATPTLVDADLTRQAGPFFANVEEPAGAGTSRMIAWSDSVPAAVHLRVSSAASGALERIELKKGSIAAFRVVVSSPAVIVNALPRVRYIDTVVSGLSEGVDVGFSNGTVTLAAGQPLGSVLLAMADRYDQVRFVPPGKDGFVLYDRLDSYALGAYVTALKSLSLSVTNTPFAGNPDAIQTIITGALESNAGRALDVRIDGAKQGRNTTTTITSSRIPSRVDFSMVLDDDNGTNKRLNVDYVASTRIAGGSLVVDSSEEGGHRLAANMTPIPAELHFCKNAQGFCGRTDLNAGNGSMSFNASEHVTVNVTAVAKWNSNPLLIRDYLILENVRLRQVAFQSGSDSDCADDDNSVSVFWIHTDGWGVDGKLDKFGYDACGGVVHVIARLNSVSANQRYVHIVGSDVAYEDGTMPCGGSTVIDYYVDYGPFNWYDVADVFCTNL